MSKTQPNNSYIANKNNILEWSIFLKYFDATKVNDEVEIGMSNLYYKLFPLPVENANEVILPHILHTPTYETFAKHSYMYTSQYTYNKLDIHVFQQNEHRMFVLFRILPTQRPDIKTYKERNIIKLEVADFIHRRIQEYSDQMKEEAFEQIYDEHSNAYEA